jgi:hypothetical protein
MTLYMEVSYGLLECHFSRTLSDIQNSSGIGGEFVYVRAILDVTRL